MSRQVTVFVANPRVAEDRDDLVTHVHELLSRHPDARLTWLQSSASYATDADSGAMADEHVLTCVAEWEIDDAMAKHSHSGTSRRKK